MTPFGFSGGNHDRLRVSAVERIRWTVGTADGAAAKAFDIKKKRGVGVGVRGLLHYLEE